MCACCSYCVPEIPLIIPEDRMLTTGYLAGNVEDITDQPAKGCRGGVYPPQADDAPPLLYSIQLGFCTLSSATLSGNTGTLLPFLH